MLTWLDGQGYRFVTVNQSTHWTVLGRPEKARGRSLRDLFGWNTPFAEGEVPAEAVRLLDQAGALERQADGLCKSRIRVASVGDQLFAHSAFPTDQEDSVFLGPDTYRFANLIEAELDGGELGAVADIGAGAGVGGLVAARRCRARRLVLTDINGKALEFAGVNAARAGVEAELVRTSALDGVEGTFDLILANPPFIAGDRGRTYRDGGDMHGARISLDWAKAAMGKLAPSGRLVLYTGSAIVEGRDPFREAMEAAAQAAGCTLRYSEIDPDIFGSELKREAYRDVERIAAVGVIAQLR